MRMDVLALDGVFDLGLSAVLDAFQPANELMEISGLVVSPFEVRVVEYERPSRPPGLERPHSRDFLTRTRLRGSSGHRFLDARSAGGRSCEAGRSRHRRGATRMGSPWRNHDCRLHRSFHNGRVWPARSPARDHNTVAG